MEREKINNFLVLSIFLVISGCGYTTGGCIYAGSKIIIKPVVNKIDITSEIRETSGYASFPILIENTLTNKLVDKFNIDGKLKVVSQDPQALLLTCTVTNYVKETLRYEDNNEDVKEQRLRLHVHTTLTSPEGEVLIDRVIVGEESYFLSGSGARSESSAQMDLIDDTARRISEAVLEQW